MTPPGPRRKLIIALWLPIAVPLCAAVGAWQGAMDALEELFDNAARLWDEKPSDTIPAE